MGRNNGSAQKRVGYGLPISRHRGGIEQVRRLDSEQPHDGPKESVQSVPADLVLADPGSLQHPGDPDEE